MPVREAILRRLGAVLDGGGLEALERMSARDLKALMLHVLGRHMDATTPLEALRAHERLAALRWAPIDARRLREIEAHAFDAASAFDAFALPPLVPLGATRALGGVSPDHVLATARGVEVLADPIVAFALEAARRRRDASTRSGTALRLCASEHVVRMQPLAVPGLLPHFTLFAAATATRRETMHEALREHVRLQIDLLARLRGAGFPVSDVEVDLSDPRVTLTALEAAGIRDARGAVRAHDFGGSHEWLARRGVTLPRGRGLALGPRVERIEREVLAPLAHAFPDVRFAFEVGRLEGLGYYTGPCLKVSARVGEARFPVADGGVLDWTARLLNDDKEIFVTSGTGLDIVARARPR